MKKQIGIYNENCTMKGSRCWDEEMIENESGDITVYSAETAEEWQDVKDLAEAYLNNKQPGGSGSFLRKVGAELMDWYEMEGPVA